MLILFILVLTAAVTGPLVVGLLLVEETAHERRWRRTLGCVAATFVALLTLSIIVIARAAGRDTLASLGTPSVRWAAAHVVVASFWPGLLVPLVAVMRGGASTETRNRAVRQWWWIALVTLAIVALTGVGASRSLDGWPALIGTRYGRLLLLQAALFATACSYMALTLDRLALALDGTDRGLLMRPLTRLVAIDVALGSSMVIVGVMLTGLARAEEPTVWPFPFKLAPGVMLRFPGVRDQVFTNSGIAAAGLLAAIAAYRMRAWRPLLLALATVLLTTGLYKGLAAMTIDAYPTTYARPAVAGTADSIRRGHTLFAHHCAPCHGEAGRGDGPAGAGLLQRPADLTAPHTADHTPGDLFWWITHGLGLAMPAFGDQLSSAERWDLVNFVRTLPEGQEQLSASPTSGVRAPGPPLVAPQAEAYTQR